MALTIQNYLQPGAYSTIVPNPSVSTASGVPVVAIVGQALQGPFTPQLFFDPSDSQNMYGYATKSNPLSLAINLAFQNGAPRVLGLNVEPDSATSAYTSILLSSLPTSAYGPAPTGTVDAVTGLPFVNSAIAGTFYIQDFNPLVPDPILNSSVSTTQNTFALAGNTSLLQYVQLFGESKVPTENSSQLQVVVYDYDAPDTPVNTITQAQFNQFNNALALLNAFNGTYQCPVGAMILIPDSQQLGLNPLSGYRELYSSVGTTVNAGTNNAVTINTETDAISYAVNNGGILYIYALTPGTQHQIFYGLFDSNSSIFGLNQAFGLPVENGTLENPFGVIQSGASDGVVTNNSYINAINSLSNQRADVIVVLNTDPGIQTTLQTYVTVQSSTDYRNECVGIVSGPISEIYTTSVQNVTALQGGAGAERMMYIYPTAAFINDPILNTTVALDGTYLGCAIAGILTSHDAAEPLTHKTLSGFIDVAVHLDNVTANSIAQYGICIVENSPNYGLRVRDQLTCDPSTPETQEISVVRQLDFVAQSLRDLMEANIVATKITRSTIGVVTSLTTTEMQSLEDSGIIYGYKNVAARINPNDPRQIDLSVTVRPAYPCKYVQITISVTSSLTGLS